MIAIALAVYAAIDCTRAGERERRGVPVGLWLALIVLLPFVGPILWLLMSRLGSAGGGTVPRARPLAPDDDPDFLRDIDRRNRRSQPDEPGEDPTA